MVYCKKVLCGIITWPTQLCGVSQYPFLIFYFKIFFPLSWSLCKTYDSTSSAISFRLIPKPRLANWTIHTFKMAVSSSLKMGLHPVDLVCPLQLLLHAFLATTLEYCIFLLIFLMICFCLVAQQGHLPMPFGSSVSFVF